MSTLAGKKFGPWLLEERVATRPFGEVYIAQHEELPRRAIVKVIHPNWALQEGARRRFQLEATSAAELRSPHIVHIHDYSSKGELPFIAVEYLNAGTLRGLMDRLSKGEERLDLRERVDLIHQAALGLQAAHEHPRVLIHRDITPETLLLERRDPRKGHAPYTLKIADLGLLRALNDGARETTIALQSVSSGAYMSPELFLPGAVDVRSDLYSLGVVFFELLTGQMPFQVKSFQDAFFKHAHEAPPSPRSLNNEVPPELDALILRCLEKAPDRRVGSARELALTLRDWLGPQVSEEAALLIPEPRNLVITPEVSAAVKVKVSNQGRLVGHWELVLEGFEAAWVQIRSQAIQQLMPQSTGEVTLDVRVPRDWRAAARQYAVAIRVRSTHSGRSVPDSETFLYWTVLPFSAPELKVELAGRTVTGRADGVAVITNKGNQPESVTPGIDCAPRTLLAEIDPSPVQIQPGGQVRVPFELRAEPFWIGRPRVYEVAVGDATGRNLLKTEKVTLVQAQRIPPAWLVVGGIAFVLAALGAVVLSYRCELADRFGDRDHVLCEADLCPEQPEHWDGFEDDDGCPDPDNDKDGVPDLDATGAPLDRCPLQPEDLDQHDDQDGCPDPDNDNDQILDVVDQCSLQPEGDLDGFQDADGCPDPDNDGDGLVDERDGCPSEAGPAESNGCKPNKPNKDDDEVPDAFDLCPDEAGWSGASGCPDTDKDKVPNKSEVPECIDAFGSVRAHGCPDSDNDGVRDDNGDDKCPRASGPPPDGCPSGLKNALRYEAETRDVPSPRSGKIANDVRSNPKDVIYSAGEVLLWKGARVGAVLEVPVPIDQDGVYDVTVAVLRGPEYGAVKLTLGGVTANVDALDVQAYQMSSTYLNHVKLESGPQTMTVELTGKGAEDADVILDYIEVARVGR